MFPFVPSFPIPDPLKELIASELSLLHFSYLQIPGSVTPSKHLYQHLPCRADLSRRSLGEGGSQTKAGVLKISAFEPPLLGQRFAFIRVHSRLKIFVSP